MLRRNPHNIFLNALFGLRHEMPPPRRCDIPSEAITPEKAIQHHRKAQARFGRTGTVPPLIGSQFVEISAVSTSAGFWRKLHNSSTFGKCQSRCCDELRRPRRDTPAALQWVEKLRPRLSSACLGCRSYLHNFSSPGENHSRSWPFLQYRFSDVFETRVFPLRDRRSFFTWTKDIYTTGLPDEKKTNCCNLPCIVAHHNFVLHAFYGAFELALFFVLGFIGFLLIVMITEPHYVKPAYVRYIRYLIALGLLVSGAVVVQKIMEIYGLYFTWSF